MCGVTTVCGQPKQNSISEILMHDDAIFRHVMAREAALILGARRDAKVALEALTRAHEGALRLD